jgi:molecular chaperone GrpE
MNDPVQVEHILDRFREWLLAARLEAGAFDALATGHESGSGEPQPELGIIDLVEEFTALRHELKLQTKSGRGLLEQADAMVQALQQAIEHFRSVEPREAQAAWLAGKPLAEALADLDEALDRGRREIEKARHRIADQSIAVLTASLDDRFRRRSMLRRWQVWAYHQEVLEVVREAGHVRSEFFDSLLEGYGLIQNRLRRVLKAEQIERIPCEDHPVDPERMTVIEVVDDPGRPPGTVVKELRSGYTWKDRVLRFAEVQASSAFAAAALTRETSTGFDSEGDGGSGTVASKNGDGENGIGFDIEQPSATGAAGPAPE